MTTTALEIPRGGFGGRVYACPRCGTRRTHVTNHRRGLYAAPIREHSCRHGIPCLHGAFVKRAAQEPCPPCERRAGRAWIADGNWRGSRTHLDEQSVYRDRVETYGPYRLARAAARVAVTNHPTAFFSRRDIRRNEWRDVDPRDVPERAKLTIALRVRPFDFDPGPMGPLDNVLPF